MPVGSGPQCYDTRRAVPSRSTLVATWVAAVAVLAAVLVLSRVTQTPGDDVDPARQRPGILDLGELPVAAPRLTPEVPHPQKPTVIFFAARKFAELCEQLAAAESFGDVAIAVVTDVRAECADRATVVERPVGETARSFGLRLPRGGGEPTGYAVVDARGRIRYRTLDPVAPALLDEVATMVGAL